MQYTHGQNVAIAALRSWIATGSRTPFYLDGYAGTGKTTTVTSPEVLEVLGRVAFLAPTHKAAHVLVTKGVAAQTIYSAIYGRPDTETRCTDCNASSLGELEPDEDCGHPDTTLKPIFREGGLRGWSESHPLWRFDTVLVDEVSMVPADVIEHLIRLPLRVVLMGDSFQLGPVSGKAWTDGRRPDAQLTEVVRTAYDSPVLLAATAIRIGVMRTLPGGAAARSSTHPDDHDWRDHMVVCATNADRQRMNMIRRRDIFGLGSGDLPRAGEPIVARANYPEIGLRNSAPTFNLDEDARLITPELLAVVIHGQEHLAYLNGFTDPNVQKNVWAQLPQASSDRRLRLQFAYAITAHSSQGSEWPYVTVHGSWRWGSALEQARWAYTAYTRASVNLHITGA